MYKHLFILLLLVLYSCSGSSEALKDSNSEKDPVQSRVEALYTAVLNSDVDKAFKLLPSKKDVDFIYLNSESNDEWKHNLYNGYGSHLKTERVEFIKEYKRKLPTNLNVSKCSLKYYMLENTRSIQGVILREGGLFFQTSDGDLYNFRFHLINSNGRDFIFLTEPAESSNISKKDVQEIRTIVKEDPDSFVWREY